MSLRVACAWCLEEMTPGTEPTSHGICERCAKEQFPEPPHFEEELPMRFTMTARLSGSKVDLRLQHTDTTAQVFWSKQGNSYVIAREGPRTWWGDVWTMADGTRVTLLSINGQGDVRWGVPHNGSTGGDLDAADYFGLAIPRDLKSDLREDR